MFSYDEKGDDRNLKSIGTENFVTITRYHVSFSLFQSSINILICNTFMYVIIGQFIGIIFHLDNTKIQF